nr:hypothetical protein [Dyella sp. ASV24]
MPFEKVIEDSHLRYRWTGSTTLNPDYRFVEFNNRRGQLYVRVDVEPWTYFLNSGQPAPQSTVIGVLGRTSTATRLIKQAINNTVKLKREPSRGNPYGRFPEGTEFGVLGCYDDMSEVDFTKLADGPGLRILDEKFIEVYAGYPEQLEDEWGRRWTRLSVPSEYRPWGVYVAAGEHVLAPPDADRILAARTTAGLPEILPLPVHITLTDDKMDVIRSLDRKTFDDQKKVMKNNSANEMAKLLGLAPVGFEWLHLIAFSLGGHQGQAQIPENLVLGTESANTAMMLIEGFVKDQLRTSARYKSVTICVSRTCPVRSCGWFVTNIRYMIKFDAGKGMSKKYVLEQFNPLQTIAPPFAIKEMAEKVRGFRSAKAPVPVSDTMRKPGTRPRRL